MPSRQTSTLGNFIFIFVILSVFVWIISFVPTLKEGLKKFQGVINMFFQSPLLGLVIFVVVASFYFSTYYVSAFSLDDHAQKFISQFVNFWAIFITLVAVSAALYSSWSSVSKTLSSSWSGKIR